MFVPKLCLVYMYISRLEIRRARAILDPSSEGSEVGVLFKTLENQLKECLKEQKH